MRVDVVTIFPLLFDAFLEGSFVGIARRGGQLDVAVHDLRAWTHDRHRSVDDAQNLARVPEVELAAGADA